MAWKVVSGCTCDSCELERLRAIKAQLMGTLEWLLENDELTKAGIGTVRVALQDVREYSP